MLLPEGFKSYTPVWVDIGADRPMVVDFEDALRLMTLGIYWTGWYARVASGKFAVHQLLKGGAKGEVLHHRDGDRLNNSKSNLESLDRRTHTQMHRASSCRCLSRRPPAAGAGVRMCGIIRRGSWKFESQTKARGVYAYLGRWPDAEQAGLVYDWVARVLYGPQCRVNFSDRVLRCTAAYMMRTCRGSFEVEFIKRSTGQRRIISCYIPVRYEPGLSAGGGPGPFYAARHNLIIVRSPGVGFRALPIEGVLRVKMGGKEYRVV